MLDNPVVCSPDITINKAFDRMRMSKVNSILVINERTKEMVGLIKPKTIQTVKDRTRKVSEVMITDFVWTKPEDTIVDILKVVDDNEISEIPVLDENRRLLGLVTENSLITTLSQQYFDEEETLEPVEVL